MNLKNRLVKLERTQSRVIAPLLMIQFDDEWTPEQLQQMNEAQVQGRMIIRVVFVDGKPNVDA